MKFKFLGVLLLAVFALMSTSCKSGKNCSGGGWYGNRNLSYEVKTDKSVILPTEDAESVLMTDTIGTANP